MLLQLLQLLQLLLLQLVQLSLLQLPMLATATRDQEHQEPSHHHRGLQTWLREGLKQSRPPPSAFKDHLLLKIAQHNVQSVATLHTTPTQTEQNQHPSLNLLVLTQM
jgi:hypothetical protein